MQRIVLALFACATIVAIGGCGSSSTSAPAPTVVPSSTPAASTQPTGGGADSSKFGEKIVGVWLAPAGKENTPEGTTLEFARDGKFIVTLPGKDKVEKLEGSYKIAGDKLTTTMKTPDGAEESQTDIIKDITDAKMVWQSGEQKRDVTFTRKK